MKFIFINSFIIYAFFKNLIYNVAIFLYVLFKEHIYTMWIKKSGVCWNFQYFGLISPLYQNHVLSENKSLFKSIAPKLLDSSKLIILRSPIFYYEPYNIFTYVSKFKKIDIQRNKDVKYDICGWIFLITDTIPNESNLLFTKIKSDIALFHWKENS